MSRRAPHLHALACATVGASLLAPAASAAADDDTRDACIAAAESAQAHRKESKLRVARDELLTCARDSCPSIVRKDCALWMAEVDASLPTVVLLAQDAAGGDLTDVRVSIDDVPVVARLDGRPLELDPGEHRIRLESRGRAPVVKHVLVAAGEKNRRVAVTFEDAEPKRGVSPGVYAAGGLGVLALGSFVFFGVSASHDVGHLHDTCAPGCASADVAAARTKAVVADVSLGLAVVSLGIGAWLLLRRPDAARTTTREAARF